MLQAFYLKRCGRVTAGSSQAKMKAPRPAPGLSPPLERKRLPPLQCQPPATQLQANKTETQQKRFKAT